MKSLSRRSAIRLGLISGPATCGAFAQEERTKLVPATIDVAIAVPIYDGTRPITIGPSRHYHVVIANRSDQPLRLWDDHCSEGEFNLAFEVADEKGLKLIRRRGQDWSKNFPIALELQPGDQFVLEFSLDPAQWELPWSDSEIGTRRIRMRAIYEIEPTKTAGKHGIWTGKVASRYGDYTLRDNRR